MGGEIPHNNFLTREMIIKNWGVLNFQRELGWFGGTYGESTDRKPKSDLKGFNAGRLRGTTRRCHLE